MKWPYISVISRQNSLSFGYNIYKKLSSGHVTHVRLKRAEGLIEICFTLKSSLIAGHKLTRDRVTGVGLSYYAW